MADETPIVPTMLGALVSHLGDRIVAPPLSMKAMSEFLDFEQRVIQFAMVDQGAGTKTDEIKARSRALDAHFGSQRQALDGMLDALTQKGVPLAIILSEPPSTWSLHAQFPSLADNIERLRSATLSTKEAARALTPPSKKR